MRYKFPDNPVIEPDSATLLSAMANSKRLIVLCMLAESEASVGQLAEAAKLSQSATSQHLNKLRANGLVTTRRDAQTIYYMTNSKAVKAILKSLQDISEGAAFSRPAA